MADDNFETVTGGDPDIMIGGYLDAVADGGSSAVIGDDCPDAMAGGGSRAVADGGLELWPVVFHMTWTAMIWMRKSSLN